MITRGIAKNYFMSKFSKLKMKKSYGGASISLDLSAFGHKLDIAQDALDAQVWADMQKYMPMDKGTLIAQTDILNQSTRGEVYCYPPSSDYGHYQWEGYKYVDPVYNIGAFYSEDYGYWSRPGIPKVKSEVPLFYQRPSAEAHWDEKAYDAHKKDWLRVARKAMR